MRNETADFYDELQIKIFDINVKNGWHNTERTKLEFEMLIVTEIAEAAEDIRNGNNKLTYEQPKNKPVGLPSEIADIIIRSIDYLAFKKQSLGSYFKLYPFSDDLIQQDFRFDLHSDLEAMYYFTHLITRTYKQDAPFSVYMLIVCCLFYAETKNWDMKKIIDEKLAYNAKRGYRHGGKLF